jgi:predicted nucleotidyltransferase
MRALQIDGMALARRGAALLYREGAQTVWVFGSVAKGRPLDFRSDIDFAVQGFPPEKVLRIQGELERLLGLPVDLIEMEEANDELRRQVTESGVMVADGD